ALAAGVASLPVGMEVLNVSLIPGGPVHDLSLHSIKWDALRHAWPRFQPATTFGPGIDRKSGRRWEVWTMPRWSDSKNPWDDDPELDEDPEDPEFPDDADDEPTIPFPYSRPDIP